MDCDAELTPAPGARLRAPYKGIAGVHLVQFLNLFCTRLQSLTLWIGQVSDRQTSRIRVDVVLRLPKANEDLASGRSDLRSKGITTLPRCRPSYCAAKNALAKERGDYPPR